jgi:D-alanyl-D-alanine carboxypeptidase
MAYADNGGAALTPDPVPHAYARRPIARCWQDPDAAYDPDAPCRAAPPMRLAAAPPPPMQHYAAVSNAACWHDPNAAYDPNTPCKAPPMEVAEAPMPPAPAQYAQAQGTMPGQTLWGSQTRLPPAPVPAHHSFASYLIPSAAAAEVAPMHAAGAWAIQVGAFEDAGQARQIADSARGLDPQELRGTRVTLGATAPFGGHVLYRARLVGLSAQDAQHACSLLAMRSQACVTVPPGG